MLNFFQLIPHHCKKTPHWLQGFRKEQQRLRALFHYYLKIKRFTSVYKDRRRQENTKVKEENRDGIKDTWFIIIIESTQTLPLRHLRHSHWKCTEEACKLKTITSLTISLTITETLIAKNLKKQNCKWLCSYICDLFNPRIVTWIGLIGMYSCSHFWADTQHAVKSDWKSLGWWGWIRDLALTKPGANELT